MPVSPEQLKKYESHLFDRAYMSGVERTQERVKAYGEIFTPRDLVNELLDKMVEHDEDVFKDPKRTFFDPTCGDGEFLAGVLYRRLENGISLRIALKTLYGMDIHEDNIEECHKRLKCGSCDKKISDILKKNIIPEDALEYFGEQIRMQFES